MQNLFKKFFFQNVLSFYRSFFIDIITPIISSTQITNDVTCVQHVIHSFLHSLSKKRVLTV